MAVNNNMIYTRVCVDCGKVMHNVGRRAERCPECRAVHIRVKALEAAATAIRKSLNIAALAGTL